MGVIHNITNDHIYSTVPLSEHLGGPAPLPPAGGATARPGPGTGSRPHALRWTPAEQALVLREEKNGKSQIRNEIAFNKCNTSHNGRWFNKFAVCVKPTSGKRTGNIF